jgi:hypothetical protein
MRTRPALDMSERAGCPAAFGLTLGVSGISGCQVEVSMQPRRVSVIAVAISTFCDTPARGDSGVRRLSRTEIDAHSQQRDLRL